ncbi:MAG: YqaA family protein [Crocinitomicaceae bacterium]|jgi:membrane protein YqaA with SNARE-associated domain
MWEFEFGYLGLFVTCFLAATILPIASELFLTGMLALGYNPIVCLFVAGTANTLGGWLNYFIGYLGNPKWLIKLGATAEKINSWKERVNQYGVWLALFSWLPLIGDVIGIALGFFRVNVVFSFLFIAIGKFIRYGVIIVFYLYFKTFFD